MRNVRQTQIREALWRLTAPRPLSSDASGHTPFLLRTPAIAALWGATLLAVVALLALGRVRVPRVERGTVVAVGAGADSVALILLLPPTARPFLAPGQTLALDTGGSGPTIARVTSVDETLLDVATARRAFPGQASLIAQLDAPKLAARVTSCRDVGCLTPHAGETFAATARLGTRSLASYAVHS